MNRNRKRIVSLFVCAMLLLAMFAACTENNSVPAQNTPTASDAGSPGDGPSEDIPEGSGSDAKKFVVTICGGTLEDGINVITKRNAEGWNTFAATKLKEKFPDYEVIFNAIPWENASAKMQTLLSSGSTDLFTVGGAFIPQYYSDELIQSLMPYMEKDVNFNYTDLYPENFSTNLNCTDYSGEQILTLPWDIGNRIIIYDKQIFDDWGVEYLSEKPTPEEILEKAEKMTGTNPKTGAQNYGLYIPVNSLNMSYVIPLSEYFGATEVEGSFADPINLQWKLNSPEFVQTMQWLIDAMKYVPMAASTGQGAENFGTEMNDLAIRMDINGMEIMNNVANAGDESLLDRFEPTMHFGNNGGNWTPIDGIGMAKHLSGEKADNAWELLKYLCGVETSIWRYEQFGPKALAIPSLASELYDTKDKYLEMNTKVMHAATHPGYEINPFYGSTIQPTWASMLSNSIAGEIIDVQKELDELQKKAEAWSANK